MKPIRNWRRRAIRGAMSLSDESREKFCACIRCDVALYGLAIARSLQFFNDISFETDEYFKKLELIENVQTGERTDVFN